MSDALKILQAIQIGCYLNNTIHDIHDDSLGPRLVLGSKIPPYDDMIIRIIDGQAFLKIRYLEKFLSSQSPAGVSFDSYCELKFRGVDLCDPDLFDKIDIMIDDAIAWSRKRKDE